MSCFVVDASVALKWVIGEVGEEAALRLRGAMLTAPEILLAECGSALRAKARRREIDEHEAHDALASLHAAPVVLAPLSELVADALHLAFLLAHPIYDCLYLALAMQTGTRLVTADRRFADAVRRHPPLADRIVPLDDVPQAL
ncbi:MAG: type II toxin-antitoxin system VapC family toxin [Geminicoccaceae bacterium]